MAKLIEFNGKLARLSEHCKDLGISDATIYYRRAKTGETILECLTYYYKNGIYNKSVELDGEWVSKREYCEKLGYDYISVCNYVSHYSVSWEKAVEMYLDHRDKRKVKDWRFYSIWQNMVGRCTNPKHISFPRYGGRKPVPVKICDRWLDYFNFEDDMLESYIKHVEEYGEKDTTINRKNDGNYCIEDCEWATLEEQANDKRNNRIVAEGLTLAQFCKKYNLPYGTTYKRLELGWTIEEILDTPVNHVGNNHPHLQKIISPWGETLDEISERTGIKRRTLYDRYTKGWSWEDIISDVSTIVLETGETIKELSERIGIPQSTIRNRYAKGWSLERIINTPYGGENSAIILPTGETLTEFSKRTGISKKTLESRIYKGWSLEEVVNTPLREKYSSKSDKN